MTNCLLRLKRKKEVEKLKEIMVFSGSSHRELSRKICERLGIPLSFFKTKDYSNKCLERILRNDIRKKTVILVQTSSSDNLYKDIWELFLMMKTVSVFGAKEIIVIMPYVSYSRSDKPYTEGMIVAGEFLVELLEEKGIKRFKIFIGIDFHSEKFEKFFSRKTKVYHLSALPLIAKALKEGNLENTILMAPDEGAYEKTSFLAEELEIPFGWVEKERISDTEVRIKEIHGEVAGKDVIVLDDEISTGTTIKTLAEELRRLGAESLTVAVTHGLFLKKAVRNFQDIKILREIIVTDTVPVPRKARKFLPLRILSVDKLLADKIKEICKPNIFTRIRMFFRNILFYLDFY